MNWPNRRPVATFRAGNVTCAVWEDEVAAYGLVQMISKVTFGRRYKDRWGYWKSAFSFSKKEIPLVIHVLKLAFETMINRHIDQEIARAIE